MSSEEDTELRDLIIQTLENNGVIGKIKAELRASVFLALEEEGSFRDKIPLANTKLMQFMSTADGILTVSLVREFLQFFNLNFTLAVFDPEITTCDFLSKEEICRKLRLDSTKQALPVLTDLIKLNDKRDNPTDFNNKRTTEPNIINAGSKVSDNESSPLHFGNNRETFSPDVCDKFAEINFENPPKASEENTSYTNDDRDPFFDEPLPLEKRPYFSVSKDDVDKDATGRTLNNHSDVLGLKPGTKGLEKSSLSSLKDLPSLNTKNSEVPQWDLGKSAKKKVPLMDLEMHGAEGEYDDEDFQSSGSGHSTKSSQNSVNMVGQPKTDGSDNPDNSEQSIEEEIEEDLSGGVDDLLNSSLSLGDDATTDQTISQISLIGGSDYMESCNPSK